MDKYSYHPSHSIQMSKIAQDLERAESEEDGGGAKKRNYGTVALGMTAHKDMMMQQSSTESNEALYGRRNTFSDSASGDRNW